MAFVGICGFLGKRKIVLAFFWTSILVRLFFVIIWMDARWSFAWEGFRLSTSLGETPSDVARRDGFLPVPGPDPTSAFVGWRCISPFGGRRNHTIWLDDHASDSWNLFALLVWLSSKSTSSRLFPLRRLLLRNVFVRISRSADGDAFLWPSGAPLNPFCGRISNYLSTSFCQLALRRKEVSNSTDKIGKAADDSYRVASKPATTALSRPRR